MKSIVLVPTYNEKENIGRMVKAISQLPTALDILVIDDNSPDGTGGIVREMQGSHPHLHLLARQGKEGLGRAYIAGFTWALQQGYDLIFEMDCDFSHNPNDLEKLHEVLARGEAEVVIGSRYVTGVNVVNWPIGRVLLSYFASSYVRRVLGMPIKDSTAGFVGFHRKVLETIELDRIKFKGYAFQIEMKFNAWKYGYRIKEVPIIFTDRSEGQSKMSKGIVREAFFGVLELKVWSWFHRYKRK